MLYPAGSDLFETFSSRVFDRQSKTDTKAVQQRPLLSVWEIKAQTSKQSIKAGIPKLCFCLLSFFFLLLVLILAERDLEDQQDNVVTGDGGQMSPAGL